VRKKKISFSNFILLIAFVTGLSLLLYPAVSDFWNSKHQTQAIADYAVKVEETDDISKEILWNDAVEYNRQLAGTSQKWTLTEDEKKEYGSLLDVSGTGVMGYVEIPSIKVSLPIYHGTDEEVLQIAIGHIEGSSLPVGGASTHCVISGHRGLPSAKLFSNLDKLVEGDLFMLQVMDEVLVYEVDQIRIVEPEETEDLKIELGKDYCTLVTCTPYGVNSHRMLVRGHRTEDPDSYINVTADAIEIEPFIVAAVLAVPVLIILYVIVLIGTGKRERRRKY